MSDSYDDMMRNAGYTIKKTFLLVQYIKPPVTTSEREKIHEVRMEQKEEEL